MKRFLALTLIFVIFGLGRTASLLVALLALALSGCAGTADRAPVSPVEHAEASTDVVFNVQGMHCDTCPLTVRTAAEGLDGVLDARVSLSEGRAWIRYDSRRTSPVAIARAITRSGYPATAARER